MQKEIIIEACKHLLENGPYEVIDGICENIDSYLFFNDIDMFAPNLEEQFKSWEHFSGRTVFPVPSSDPTLSPQEFYQLSNNLWWGEQLEYRISLLNHIIKELSK